MTTPTRHSFSRRDVLKAGTALAATVFAAPVRAAPPEPAAITPTLVEAAKKEGKLAFYTAMDLAFAQRLAKTFEEKFPGIGVRVERSGAERIFTRIGQEYGSNIHAVDVVNTADQAHCIVWKRNGWLAPYMPEEVAKHFEPKYYDPDGLHITTRILISPLAYNTNLVKKEEAPKSFADLLDPKWAGKLVKAHPASSTRRMPPISSSGSGKAFSRPTCRKRWPSIFPPSTRTRTGCSRAFACSFASWVTTPTW